MKVVVDDDGTELDGGVVSWDESTLKTVTVPDIIRDWRLFSDAMCFLTDGAVGFEPIVVEDCWDVLTKAHNPFWDSKYKRCISHTDFGAPDFVSALQTWEEGYAKACGQLLSSPHSLSDICLLLCSKIGLLVGLLQRGPSRSVFQSSKSPEPALPSPSVVLRKPHGSLRFLSIPECRLCLERGDETGYSYRGQVCRFPRSPVSLLELRLVHVDLGFRKTFRPTQPLHPEHRYFAQVCDRCAKERCCCVQERQGDSDVLAFHLLFPAGRPSEARRAECANRFFRTTPESEVKVNITVGGIAAGTVGHRAFKGRPAYQERRIQQLTIIVNSMKKS